MTLPRQGTRRTGSARCRRRYRRGPFRALAAHLPPSSYRKSLLPAVGSCRSRYTLRVELRMARAMKSEAATRRRRAAQHRWKPGRPCRFPRAWLELLRGIPRHAFALAMLAKTGGENQHRFSEMMECKAKWTIWPVRYRHLRTGLRDKSRSLPRYLPLLHPRRCMCRRQVLPQVRPLWKVAGCRVFM